MMIKILRTLFDHRQCVTGRRGATWLAMIPLGMMLSPAFAATLEKAEFASRPGNQAEIDLVF
jgi:hypothetical protein